MSFKVALEALATESQLWDRVSATMSLAQLTADSLTLSGTHLSWAGEVSGLVDTCHSLQTHLATILGEGAQAYLDLSVTLDEVGMAYQLDDEKAARTFEGLWEPDE